MTEASGLTRNQQLVLDALSQEEGPLSAYAILDRLRDDGMRAPLQVYRALDKLVEQGLVHRLESLNAFVACAHPDCETHRSVAFAICDKCGRVSEFTDEAISARLVGWARSESFRLQRTTIELRGLCADCAAG